MLCAIIGNGQVTNIIATDNNGWPDSVDITHVDPMPGIGWSYADGVFAPPPAPPAPPPANHGTRITPLAFITRWTPAEEIAIRTAAKQDASIETMIAHVQLASFIDLADPRTRSSVQALETAGLLGAGRSAVILDTPVAATELPA